MEKIKKDLPKWSELTIIERVLLVISYIIWFGALSVYTIALYKDNIKLEYFNYIMPLVALSLFMEAYVYRSKKEIAIVCGVCGTFLIIMAIIFTVLFN